MPASRDTARKRDTIGTSADDLDASDIRLLLERDAKRRDTRKKEQQEKLDKKLRSRGGRNRGDSDKRRREAEELRRVEEAKQRADEENRARAFATPPTAVHPALRNTPQRQQPAAVGLGLSGGQAEAGASESEGQAFETPLETPVDPFADPADDHETTPTPTPMPLQDQQMSAPGDASRDAKMEDPAIETAREVRLSQAATPPTSPVQGARATNSLSQALDSRRASELSPPPPSIDQRRVSEPKPERRAGAWATFFRRGGTRLQRPDDGKPPPSEHSFSNTSRESMRNQPIPPHLIDTQVQTRRKSGTPVRTQSKFREDLPEMPISPPDSRLPSPDVTTAAAAAAAARRARSSAPPQDVTMTEAEPQSSTRTDTPVTPSQHRITSMASIDSEGSWLASGSAKRASAQSGLNQRKAEFTGSYEELGGDRDAEYVNRPSSSARKISSPALTAADLEEESGEDEAEGTPAETPGDPMTVHESVRRKPTLVHRDPRVQSREGLLAEYATGEGDTPLPTSAGTGGRGSMEFDPEEPEPEIQRASSVGYGKGQGQGHARQISAGSAKLFEVPPRSPTSHPMPWQE